MKTAGWILIAIAGVELVAATVGLAATGDPATAKLFDGVLLFGVIGSFLLQTGIRKEQEKQEHDAWEKE